VAAALNGHMEKMSYKHDMIFGFAIPESCPGVPEEMLDPRNTWEDKEAYDTQARELAGRFIQNFKKYASMADPEILSASPII
jgi:phosphoenolpyruvate carboxykinase (ATP)